MNIAGTEYNLNNRAFEIYVSGCKGPYCAGCHNPDLWDFKFGQDLDMCSDYLTDMLGYVKHMCDYIWILGGEPQDSEDINYLLKIAKATGKKVVMFTRYTTILPHIDTSLIDYVKFGPYDMFLEGYTEPVLGIKLASNNQWVEEV